MSAVPTKCPILYQVEEWYDWRRTTLGENGGEKQEKKVYLATDDKSALSEAMTR